MIDAGEQRAEELAVGDDAADRDAAEADAVIAALAADQARARALPRARVIGERDLQRGVDRFRAGIAEEHVVEIARRQRRDARSRARRPSDGRTGRPAHSRARRPGAGSPRRSARGCGRHCSTTGRRCRRARRGRRACSNACPRRARCSRGRFLKARLAVNGIQKASRSLGTVIAGTLFSTVMPGLCRAATPCFTEHVFAAAMEDVDGGAFARRRKVTVHIREAFATARRRDNRVSATLATRGCHPGHDEIGASLLPQSRLAPIATRRHDVQGRPAGGIACSGDRSNCASLASSSASRLAMLRRAAQFFGTGHAQYRPVPLDILKKDEFVHRDRLLPRGSILRCRKSWFDRLPRAVQI